MRNSLCALGWKFDALHQEAKFLEIFFLYWKRFRRRYLTNKKCFFLKIFYFTVIGYYTVSLFWIFKHIDHRFTFFLFLLINALVIYEIFHFLKVFLKEKTFLDRFKMTSVVIYFRFLIHKEEMFLIFSFIRLNPLFLSVSQNTCKWD